MLPSLAMYIAMAAIAFQGGVAAAAEAQPSSTSCNEASCAEDSAVLLQRANKQGVGVDQSNPAMGPWPSGTMPYGVNPWLPRGLTLPAGNQCASCTISRPGQPVIYPADGPCIFRMGRKCKDQEEWNPAAGPCAFNRYACMDPKGETFCRDQSDPSQKMSNTQIRALPDIPRYQRVYPQYCTAVPTASPTPVPTASPTEEPTEEPTDAPTRKPTEEPADDACTDTPSQYMKKKNLTCDSWGWGVQLCKHCKNKESWVKGDNHGIKYCRLSCFNAGCGYDDITCP